MANIIKTGRKYKVVNSVNKKTVKGGSGLSKKQAQAKKREVVKRNCGVKGQRCKGK